MKIRAIRNIKKGELVEITFNDNEEISSDALEILPEVISPLEYPDEPNVPYFDKPLWYDVEDLYKSKNRTK